jgi:hypothetical protein
MPVDDEYDIPVEDVVYVIPLIVIKIEGAEIPEGISDKPIVKTGVVVVITPAAGRTEVTTGALRSTVKLFSGKEALLPA